MEFTAELRDFMECEGKRYYPALLWYARILLVEAGGAVLAALDETLQREALKQLTGRYCTVGRSRSRTSMCDSEERVCTCVYIGVCGSDRGGESTCEA